MSDISSISSSKFPSPFLWLRSGGTARQDRATSTDAPAMAINAWHIGGKSGKGYRNVFPDRPWELRYHTMGDGIYIFAFALARGQVTRLQNIVETFSAQMRGNWNNDGKAASALITDFCSAEKLITLPVMQASNLVRTHLPQDAADCVPEDFQQFPNLIAIAKPNALTVA